MSWNIAHAKQQFSELVRLCAQEPQPVYNRTRQVAVVIGADDFAAFEAWRRARQAPAALELPARVDRPGAEFEPEAVPKPEPRGKARGKSTRAAQ